MAKLTYEDLLNIHEYISQASKVLGGSEEQVLREMDLSDEAWQETFKKLGSALDEKKDFVPNAGG